MIPKSLSAIEAVGVLERRHQLLQARIQTQNLARMDLDETSVRQNLVFYETLRAMRDPKRVAEAVGLRPRTAPAGL